MCSLERFYFNVRLKVKKTGNLGKLTQNTGKRYNMCVTVMRKKIGDQNCDKNVLSYYILSSLVCQHFFPLFFPMYWSSVFAKRLVMNLGDPLPKTRGKDVSLQSQDSDVGFTPQF